MALDKLTQVSGKISDKIVHTSDADTSIKFPAADTVTIETGATERLRITDDGKVGIGTDDPTGTVHIIGGQANQLWLDNTGQQYTQLRLLNDGSSKSELNYDNIDSELTLFATSGSDIVFKIGGAGVGEKLRITSAGSVGIGTTNPSSGFKLDVNGDLSLGESGGSDNTFIDQKQDGSLEIINSGRVGNNGSIRINKTNSISGDTTYFRNFEVYDGKTNLLLLVDGSSGVVGINTTTGFDTSVGLAVRNGASGSDHTMIDIIANTNETSRLVFSDDTDHNQGRLQYNHTGNSLAFYTNGNNERLRIGSAGQIGLSGDNYGTAGQVIKSTGTGTAPTWQNLHQFMFFGEQDTSHTIATGTYTRLINLGTNDFSIGDSSIASFDESVGRVTIGADGAGYYYLEMHGGIDDVQASDYVQVVIKKNGSSSGTDGTRLSTYGRGWNSGAANQVVTTSTSCIALLAAGDYVQFYIYHNEGSSEPTEQNRCAVMGYKL